MNHQNGTSTGETIKQIASQIGMKPNALRYHVKKYFGENWKKNMLISDADKKRILQNLNRSDTKHTNANAIGKSKAINGKTQTQIIKNEKSEILPEKQNFAETVVEFLQSKKSVFASFILITIYQIIHATILIFNLETSHVFVCENFGVGVERALNLISYILIPFIIALMGAISFEAVMLVLTVNGKLDVSKIFAAVSLFLNVLYFEAWYYDGENVITYYLATSLVSILSALISYQYAKLFDEKFVNAQTKNPPINQPIS